MECYECARLGTSAIAVAVCVQCGGAVCRKHVRELYRPAPLMAVPTRTVVLVCPTCQSGGAAPPRGSRKQQGQVRRAPSGMPNVPSHAYVELPRAANDVLPAPEEAVAIVDAFFRRTPAASAHPVPQFLRMTCSCLERIQIWWHQRLEAGNLTASDEPDPVR